MPGAGRICSEVPGILAKGICEYYNVVDNGRVELIHKKSALVSLLNECEEVIESRMDPILDYLEAQRLA